ncbi:MAG TPA: CPBP family glutamic-type intramembrane protease [Acidimicrobiales bacterium]|nr:CPBP family glutamic-type intramembrane protease [Acidimicrobiales bacterium]
MPLAVAGALVTVAGLVLFATFRPRARRRFSESVVVHDRAAAIGAARAHVRELTGIDVTDWPVFAVPCSDPGLLQQAHQLDVVDAVVPAFLRWGLLYGWRVRFWGREDTIVVGLGGTGTVNFLQMAGRSRNAVSALGRPTPPTVLPPPILPNGAVSASVGARVPGGAPAADLRSEAAPNPEAATFVEEPVPARVAVTVESWNGRVVGVTTRPSIANDALDGVLHADRRCRRLQRAAMQCMALALVGGGLVLAVNREIPQLGWAVVLGLVTFASVMAGEPQMFPRAVVYEFDGREPLAACRRRHRRETAVAALVNGGFVTAGVAVGGELLSMAGAAAPPSVPIQIAVGAAVASMWLGLTAAAYVLLSARGRLAATAELPPSTLRRLGYSWRELIGASIQSSIGEEVLYRLVIVSLAWYLLGQPLIGVAVAAAVWSATHDVGDVRPRRLRSLELFAFGCVLGAVFVVAGLAAAVAAHLLFNLLLLGWPLLATERRRVEALWR